MLTMILQVYVEYVIKNPAHVLGEPITSELFYEKLDAHVRALPAFS